MGGKTTTRLTIEQVKKQVEEMGGVLISTEYINNQTPLIFKCTECGKESLLWKMLKV